MVLPNDPMRLSNFDPAQVQAARERVADWYIENAHAVRKDDAYASHVTTEKKDEILATSLARAEQVRQGKCDHNFSVWQRLEVELTGECTPFLPLYVVPAPPPLFKPGAKPIRRKP